jgi:hypothetical protein
VYLIGATFVVVETDHAPLLPMFNNPNSRPPMRIERWLTYLQQFSFTLVYRPGPQNGADYLSRHPLPISQQDVKSGKWREQTVCALVTDTIPKAITLSELQEATEKDPVMKLLFPIIQNSNKAQCKKTAPEFFNVFDELCIADGLILRDNRIVLPKELQKRAVDICHEGHLGIVKTKQLLRSKVWFPGIDRLVESTVAHCMPCQAYTNSTIREPLKMSSTPTGPWVETSIDFCGPFPDGSMLLVWIDDYSRYPEVEFVPSTSCQNVVPVMEKIIATHGIPTVIRSDNGPPFNSNSFAIFCKEKDIKHRRITPLWPEANGLAEVFMKSIKKLAQTSTAEGKNWKIELYKMLGNYRSTPHPTTGFSPRELCLGRKGKGKLPEFQKPDKHYEEIEMREKAIKDKSKNYADAHRHTKSVEYKVNDLVLVKQNKIDKLSTVYEPVPYKIKKINGSMITAERVSDQRVVTRNSSFIKGIKCKTEVNNQDYEADSDSVCEFVCDDQPVAKDKIPPDIEEVVPEIEDLVNNDNTEDDHNSESELETPETRSRSGRTIVKPRHLNDFITY